MASWAPALTAGDVSTRIDRHFAGLSDSRRGKAACPLIDVLTIALCAAINGADDLAAIADRACQKRDQLGRFLDLSSGIPSHDRFNAVFRPLKPEAFERCPVSRITALHEVSIGRLAAVGGKSLRQRFKKAGAKLALRMVGVRAAADKIDPGQVAVAERNHEITAIAESLALLELQGALATIDADGPPDRNRREESLKTGPTTCRPSRATDRPCTPRSWGPSRTP